MLTILLDGIAYGMLLFVLSCGLGDAGADEFHQPRARRLRDGRRRRDARLINRPGVRPPTLSSCFFVPAALGVVWSGR